MITLPEIGETITPQDALSYARCLGLREMASKIVLHIDELISFVFDGGTGLPRWLEEIPDVEAVTREAFLVHDLEYWIGEPGDESARFQADLDLKFRIIEKSAEAGIDADIAEAVAEFVFWAVQRFGDLKTSWGWGFGWKQQAKV